MHFFIQNGIDWIIAIQSLGTWLELPMKFFTFLGYENFFFLVLPLIYWSVDTGLGLRIALILAASDYLNCIVKLAFAAPRPYWVNARVEPFSVESSFGIPSGHAQNATALWGILAAGVNKPWAWATAFILAFLIGFSRLYLGVHFLHDVLTGWLIGFVLLFGFLKLWDPVRTWLKTKTLGQQVIIAFLVSLLMIAIGVWSSARLDGYVFPVEWTENALRAGPLPDPISMEGIFTSSGSFFGLAAGAAWIASRGGYQTSGPLEKRALRYVIGLIGIMILWYGLGKIFPRGETFIPVILRYIRYSLVGFWVTAGAPWLFFHFKLADKPKIWDVSLL
ncbi:MAG TPA: phosphatase PAP2 family protein [Anaerolineales bacterium]|nr:phosphatase PAP2 family protein [Anaerolineales bacterium]